MIFLVKYQNNLLIRNSFEFSGFNALTDPFFGAGFKNLKLRNFFVILFDEFLQTLNFQTIRQLPHLNCRYVFELVSFLFCAGLVQFSASLYDDVTKNLIQISLGATILTSFCSKPAFNNLGKIVKIKFFIF